MQVGDGSKGVKVGSTIAILAEEGDEISAAEIEKLMSESDSAPKEEAPKEEAPKKSEEKAKEETKKSEPSTSSSGPSKPSVELSTDKAILATPLAKRLALEKGVPLAQLKGTGPEGRIVKADVENYKAPAAASAPAASSAPAEQTGAYTDTPVSNMRRTIAQRLTQSKTEAPNYYVTVEVQMDRVNKLRELFNKAGSASSSGGVSEGVKSGVKLSVNDFIIKAAALALQDVSEVNSGWHGDFIRSYHKQDISMAVATPNGLITPIITDCGAKGLSAISTQSKELAKKARDGKLKPEEYQGGSFCISNLGMMGVHSFTAIINPPQSCILAIGASEKKLVMDATSEKGFKEVSVMKATISADHRVVDGARAAAWMQAFKQYLESPLSFML